MLTYDVCVVGAGPAGVAAAVTLARSGLDVGVVDKATFPRDKTCGDGLTTGALRHLERLGLRPESVPSWHVVDDVWIRSPSGRTVRYPLPRRMGTFAAVARRADLDAALVGVARDAGADVHEGSALVDARQAGDCIEIDVEGVGPVRARYAVGADGQWSPLAKALGVYPDGYLGEWHAFRQYFTGVADPAATDLWVWFDEDLLPGYAWSFPLPGGGANVGFGLQRSAGAALGHMGRLWPALLQRPHVRAVLGDGAEPEAPPRAWPIPARIDRAVLASGRALFVGDAAGACDPMTGEGIGQALETGTLAAAAIAAAGPDAPHVAARRYTTGVQRGLGIDHRTSMLLLRAVRHRKGVRGAVRITGATAWTRRHFARWLFEDYPRGALVTPGRWRRDMFTGWGAFAADAYAPRR